MARLSRSLRIAVMLPAPYKSGTFDAAKAIAKMIHQGSRKAGEPVDVVFSFFKDNYDRTTDFEDLITLGIELRETVWKSVDRITVGKNEANGGTPSTH